MQTDDDDTSLPNAASAGASITINGHTYTFGGTDGWAQITPTAMDQLNSQLSSAQLQSGAAISIANNYSWSNVFSYTYNYYHPILSPIIDYYRKGYNVSLHSYIDIYNKYKDLERLTPTVAKMSFGKLLASTLTFAKFDVKESKALAIHINFRRLYCDSSDRLQDGQ